jgi:hypothetical protein
MEELLGELLGFIFEVFVEVLIQIVFEAGVAAASRAPRRFRFAPFLRVILSPSNPALKTLKFTFLGLCLGAVSLLILPHPLAHSSRFHGISLLLSPVITGIAMGLTGRIVRRRGKTPVQIESFAYGFTFAFAFALIRFLMVR